MGYSDTNRTYSVSSIQLQKMHGVYKNHDKENCLFCKGNMYEIAELFKTYELDIYNVSPKYITFKAVTNYSPKRGGSTDETNLVFRLVLGLEELTNKLTSQERICSECNSELRVFYGKYGYFIACSQCSFKRKL